MRYVLDTNVFLSYGLSSRTDHFEISEALDQAAEQGKVFLVVPQIVAEAWNVMTRPIEINGAGRSPFEAHSLITGLLFAFPLLPDPPELTVRWLELAALHNVRGRQVHDARLAALVGFHGLDGIVTNNADDFKRFGIRSLRPSEI